MVLYLSCRDGIGVARELKQHRRCCALKRNSHGRFGLLLLLSTAVSIVCLASLDIGSAQVVHHADDEVGITVEVSPVGAGGGALNGQALPTHNPALPQHAPQAPGPDPNVADQRQQHQPHHMPVNRVNPTNPPNPPNPANPATSGPGAATAGPQDPVARRHQQAQPLLSTNTQPFDEQDASDRLVSERASAHFNPTAAMAASALGNEPGEQGRPEQPDSADTGNHPVQHPPEHRHEPGASSAVSDPRHGQPSRSSASSTANVDQHAHAQQRSNEDSGAQGDNTRDQSRVPQKPAPCRDESEEARHNRRPDDDDDDDDDGRGGGGCGRGRQGGSSGSSASSSRGKAETQNVSRGSGDPQSGCGNPDTKRAKTSTRRTACTPNAPVSCTTQEAQDPQDGPVVSFAWRPFDLARSTWHTVMNSVYTVLGVDTRPLTSTRQPGCRHHKHHHRRRHRGTSTAAVHTAHCCEDCFRALRESVRLSSARTLPKSTRDWKAVPKDAMAGPWDHRHPAVTSPPRGFEQAAVRVSGGIHDCTGAAMCTACFNAMNMAVLPHLACLLQRAPQHQWTVMWVRGSIEMTRTFSNHPIKAHLETIADLVVMRTTLALHVDAADATKVLRAHARPLAVRSGGDGDSDSATHLVTRIKMGAEEIKLQDPVAVPRDRLVEATRAVAEYINDAYQIGVKELDRAVQGSLDLSCLPKRDVRVDDVDLQ